MNNLPNVIVFVTKNKWNITSLQFNRIVLMTIKKLRKEREREETLMSQKVHLPLIFYMPIVLEIALRKKILKHNLLILVELLALNGKHLVKMKKKPFIEQAQQLREVALKQKEEYKKSHPDAYDKDGAPSAKRAKKEKATTATTTTTTTTSVSSTPIKVERLKFSDQSESGEDDADEVKPKVEEADDDDEDEDEEENKDSGNKDEDEDEEEEEDNKESPSN